MVAVDDVDGMKSSVETYRTCTDKENSEPLYAKITKKKSARYDMVTASKTRHFLNSRTPALRSLYWTVASLLRRNIWHLVRILYITFIIIPLDDYPSFATTGKNN